MGLARLCLRNLQQRLQSAGTVPANTANTLRWFSTAPEKVSVDKSDSRDIEVSKGKSKPSQRKRRGLWRDGRGLSPFGFNDLFRPSGLGSGLLQLSENLNKILENWAPSGLLGRMKEDDTSYKLRFEVPGLSKEDVKITIEDGYLTIKGEHKEEEGDTSDGDQWYSSSYGYYNTSLLLPEDAKVDEIKAELKDGILNLTIPRSETPKKDVKQVEIY